MTRAADLSAVELYELLCRKVRHDPRNPAWTDALVEVHRASLERRLVVMPEFFYTPVYAPAALPPEVWEGRFDAGVDYDADAQLAFIADCWQFRDELLAFPREAPADASRLAQYPWHNSEFSHGDASLYYSLLRRHRPRRVIEVGGGFSTLLASHAAVRNGDTEVTCIEPYPRAFLARGLPCVRLERVLAQDVGLDAFAALEDGDVLFIDSSHVAKTGSDVVHLFLRVLPCLAPGVIVHVHDVFLPFEYPKAWAEQRLYWNEQYLLAALLADSAKWRVLAANHFLARTVPDRLYAFALPEIGVAAGGASFWMRALPPAPAA